MHLGRRYVDAPSIGCDIREGWIARLRMAVWRMPRLGCVESARSGDPAIRRSGDPAIR
jgi:hypothetical protein